MEENRGGILRLQEVQDAISMPNAEQQHRAGKIMERFRRVSLELQGQVKQKWVDVVNIQLFAIFSMWSLSGDSVICADTYEHYCGTQGTL